MARATCRGAQASIRNHRSQPMVGAAGFEPTASSSRTKRATRLRYAPTSWRVREPRTPEAIPDFEPSCKWIFLVSRRQGRFSGLGLRGLWSRDAPGTRATAPGSLVAAMRLWVAGSPSAGSPPTVLRASSISRLGHDHLVWDNENFQEFLSQSARRLVNNGLKGTWGPRITRS